MNKYIYIIILLFFYFNYLNATNLEIYTDVEYLRNSSNFEPNYINYLSYDSTLNDNYSYKILPIKNNVKDKDVLQVATFNLKSFNFPIQLVGYVCNLFQLVMGEIGTLYNINVIDPMNEGSRLNLPSFDYLSEGFVSMVYPDSDLNKTSSILGITFCHLEFIGISPVTKCDTISTNITVDLKQLYNIPTSHERNRNLYVSYVIESNTNYEYIVIADATTRKISIERMDSDLIYETIGISYYAGLFYIGGINKYTSETELYVYTIHRRWYRFYSSPVKVSWFIKCENTRYMMFYSNSNSMLSTVDLRTYNYKLSNYNIPQLKNVTQKNHIYASYTYPHDRFSDYFYPHYGITTLQLSFIIISPIIFVSLLSFIVYYFIYKKRKQIIKQSKDDIKMDDIKEVSNDINVQNL